MTDAEHEAMTLAQLLACTCVVCSRCTCENKNDPDVILILTRKGLSQWLEVSESAIRKAEAERRIERRPDGCFDYWECVRAWIQNTNPKRLHPSLAKYIHEIR